MNFLAYLSKLPKPFITTSGIVLVLLLGIIDHFTGDLSFLMFYLIPISLVSWYVGSLAGVLISIESIFAWYIANVTLMHTFVTYWNITEKLFFFLIVSYFLSKHKRIEETLAKKTSELERSNKELELFAHVASHDLREPLLTVSGFANLLKRRYKDKLDNDAQDYINYIVTGTARLQQLVRDLLEYARVSTSDKPFVPVDCNDVFKKVLDNLKTTIEESGAVITSDPLPTVMSDETQCIQLFQNLIGNAIKYRRDDSPRIHVSAKRIDETAHAEQQSTIKKGWLFSVSDNGIGIDPQYSEHIFQLFQRLNRGDTSNGTGIGLAICRKIVERHDGHIWVKSEPGKGSVFYFIIPLN